MFKLSMMWGKKLSREHFEFLKKYSPKALIYRLFLRFLYMFELGTMYSTKFSKLFFEFEKIYAKKQKFNELHLNFFYINFLYSSAIELRLMWNEKFQREILDFSTIC